MRRKKTYGLLLLTSIALFIAPQIAISNRLVPELVFVPILLLGLWLTVVIKNLSNPE